jgi:maltose/moltooligosaccharide transporter
VIMLLALLLLLVIIRETPTGDKWFQVGQKELKMDPLSFEIVNSQRNQPDEQEDAHIPIFTQIGDIFRHNRDMAIMLFVIFFLYLGFASIESFFSSFATSYVGFTQSQAGNLGLAYSGPMILSAPLHGIIGQKIGKKRALKISMVCQIVGVAIISAILIPLSYKQGSNPTIFILFLVNFAVISISWMGVIIQSFPVIWGLSPEGKIGSYMGVYYFFNQIAYMISPVLIGGVLSLFAGLGDERYIVMFPFVLFCLVVGFILVLFIKTPERELDQVKEKELKEKYMQDMD